MTNSPLQSGERLAQLPGGTTEPARFSELPEESGFSFFFWMLTKAWVCFPDTQGFPPGSQKLCPSPFLSCDCMLIPHHHHAPLLDPNNIAVSPPLPHLLLAVAENTKMFPARLFFSQQTVIISLIKLSLRLPCKSVLNSFVNETKISKGNLNFPGNMGMP